MAHFAFCIQNYIYNFRWTAVLIAVTKSFLEETINVKYGIWIAFLAGDFANDRTGLS